MVLYPTLDKEKVQIMGKGEKMNVTDKKNRQ